MLTNSGVGRIYRRPDGKYFVYVPFEVARDTAFPFKIPVTEKSLQVIVEFNDAVLTIKKRGPSETY